ncbi:formylglycine-generating enzyme family protein [Phenylobacterium sp. J367]|nr:formylglycine-generating enzyme family protein [Phenylobacterium sp. J367]MCR5877184.1 formylglycine-generating enzyme family protein [Phenylobacterium sp. J367]
MLTISEPPRPVHRGMVWLEGGTFRMGSDDHYPEEAPARPVRVDGFLIDTHPVTNREFARFVEATGWTTFAEIAPDPVQYPGALPEMLHPASLVFMPTEGPVPLNDITHWWRYTPGANWRQPLGPGSGLAGLGDHPVVHVAWPDVEAYARWAGKDLPTEAEWEFAARGGLDGAEYAWGDELNPRGRVMANTWLGDFPYRSTKPGRAFRTSRVGVHPANGYGLHDMIGNVWEWTKDWWGAHPPAASPLRARRAIRSGARPRTATTPANRRSTSRARCSKAARTSARRATAAATGRRRATPSRWTPRPHMWASAAWCAPRASSGFGPIAGPPRLRSDGAFHPRPAQPRTEPRSAQAFSPWRLPARTCQARGDFAGRSRVRGAGFARCRASAADPILARWKRSRP